ncbi:hypothetical protein Q3A66_01705 [Hymenobacter sp. BT770]|uniref:hypothetical protein n=1 Tax=Hymenobacter sp. BT770 TaxID=2886942 RepID=UPI001D11A153|nr:hypothetical protein [Hymenobacter sp. BT770]MCC3151656.1 hypothetical protein [Hymenobacter sp. BT770]MDO3413767.1 hypothetical protein [Hymenobacter sp. BT770]
MKVKHAFILLALGLVAVAVGMVFKICHWTGADAILITAMAMEAGGILLLVFKLLAHPGVRRLLNT